MGLIGIKHHVITLIIYILFVLKVWISFSICLVFLMSFNKQFYFIILWITLVHIFVNLSNLRWQHCSRVGRCFVDLLCMCVCVKVSELYMHLWERIGWPSYSRTQESHLFVLHCGSKTGWFQLNWIEIWTEEENCTRGDLPINTSNTTSKYITPWRDKETHASVYNSA